MPGVPDGVCAGDEGCDGGWEWFGCASISDMCSVDVRLGAAEDTLESLGVRSPVLFLSFFLSLW
jgi:hypothetical protein